jgi:hypothetical protein
MSDVLEINVPTGERIERDFTADELVQREKDQASAQLAADKQAADRIARDAAIAHAKSLGFTDEMIAVMYPNLANLDEEPEPPTD